MSAICFDLASEADDAALRARMTEDIMPGEVAVSFRREPSFFHGSKVQGSRSQIIKCTDHESGELVGLGSRFVNTVYINGEIRRVGYLSDLRIRSAYRGRTVLTQGYRFLRDLHLHDPVPFYYSMILQDNTKAKDILTSGRCGLPCYRDMGEFLTPALYLDFAKTSISIDGVVFRRAAAQDLTNIFKFISEHAGNKQLSPVISQDDFGTSRLRGLEADDFYLAMSGSDIIGVIAAWDQSEFRQTHVEGYSNKMAIMRRFYNLAARVSPFKSLPEEGARIPFIYTAFITIINNDINVFRGLLRHLYNHLRKSDSRYIIAGLHEKDPLSMVLKEYRRINVSGRLYVVHYPENQHDYEMLDNRIPYVEIAMI